MQQERTWTSSGTSWSDSHLETIYCYPQAEIYGAAEENPGVTGSFPIYYYTKGQQNPLWMSRSSLKNGDFVTEDVNRYDIGGEFTSYVGKAWYKGSYSVAHTVGWCMMHSYGDWVLYKNVWDFLPHDTVPSSELPSSDSELNTVGSKVLASMSPTTPEFTSAQFIAEISDLLFLIPQGLVKVQKLRDLAVAISTGTLAANLGWAPLLSDLDALVDLQTKINRKVRFLMDKNGKVIHRSHDLDPIVSTYRGSIGRRYPPFHGRALGSLYCWEYQTVTYTTKRRVSAAFTLVFDPEIEHNHYDIRNRLQRIIASDDIDAKLIYELIPFSWLVDYFTNLGAIVSVLNEQYRSGISTRILYAYITETKEVSAVHDVQCTGEPDNGHVDPAQFMYTRTWKRRIPISPTTLTTQPFMSLNTAQKANVAALTVLSLTSPKLGYLFRKAKSRLSKLLREQIQP